MKQTWQKVVLIIFSLGMLFAPIFGKKLAHEFQFSHQIMSEWESVEKRLDLMQGAGIQPNQVKWTIKQVVSETQDQAMHLENLRNLQNRIEAMAKKKWTKKETTSMTANMKLSWNDFLGESVYTILSYVQKNTYFIELCYQYQYTNETNLLQKQYMEKMMTETSGLFDTKPIIFSCVQGITNDKLVKSLREKMEQMLDKLHARNLTSLDEGAFVSCTAYTSQWGNTFSSAEKKINLQFAFRKGDQKTIWFLGTPMILGEYE